MFKIAKLNHISPKGLSCFTDDYELVDDINEAHAIIVRSHDMKSMEFSPNLLLSPVEGPVSIIYH